MTEGSSLLSLFRTRPPVSTRQAQVMAARLFNLNIADLSSVKELNSYQDRNFYMRGTLMRGEKEVRVSEYVLKVINHLDSNHECLIEVQGNLMLFLQARDYNCSTPVPSIFKTLYVMCKIPRGTQPGSVALETDSVALETACVSLETDSISVQSNTISNPSFDTLGSVNEAENLEDGIVIYDGKEYSEEEYFVCAVLLLNFVPGQMLNEIPLNTELLFNAGMTVGRLDRDLKVGDKVIATSMPGRERMLLLDHPLLLKYNDSNQPSSILFNRTLDVQGLVVQDFYGICLVLVTTLSDVCRLSMTNVT